MFVLPPNTITEVIDSIEINTDLSLLQILPHSHLIGEAWEIYSVDSQQDTTNIIKIKVLPKFINFSTDELIQLFLSIPKGMK